jgi:hypothetical protein
VDNEPENLKAVAEADATGEILLLHADTIFRSKRSQLPPAAVGGDAYDLTELISPKTLPRHIQFVWENISDTDALDLFLKSEVHWGHFEVRPDRLESPYLAYPRAWNGTTLPTQATRYSLIAALSRLAETEKGLRINLGSHAAALDPVLKLLAASGVADARLWFSGSFDALGEQGIRRIAAAFPAAIIECPIDFLAPLISGAPTRSRQPLKMFKDLGIGRFGMSWQTPNIVALLDRMDAWGYEVNVYDVRDLESFLRAVLLMPRSITASYCFPKWRCSCASVGGNGRQATLAGSHLTRMPLSIAVM